MPRPVRAALLAALLAAPLAALLALAGGCGGDDGGGEARAGRSVFAVLDRVTLPARPGGLAGGEGALWATNPEAGELIRIDAVTGEVAETYAVAQAATAVTTGGGSVWVVDPLASEIVRVDEATGKQVARIPLSNPAEIAFGFGSLWAVEGAGVARVDAATNRVVARVAMPGPVGALGVGADAVWAAGRGRGDFDLARIDPDTNRRTAEIELGEFIGASWVATTPGATWAATTSPDAYGLARIDSRTNRVLGLVPLSRQRFPFLGRVAADDRAVWFVSAVHVGRIDPRTNRVTARVNASTFERRAPARRDYSDLGAAVVVDGDLWVVDPATPAVVRVGRGS